MKRLAMALSVMGISAGLGADRSDATAGAKRAAVDLAGTRAPAGFRLHGGHCVGTLQPGATRVFQVNLFEGNRYWFSAAASPNAGAISVRIFDESGRMVTTENYQDGPRAAAGFTPDASGSYFVKVEQTGNHVSTFCLVYSYK